MYMFQSILETIPKTRLDMVNELEIPEGLTLQPYVWTEPEEAVDTDSLPSVTNEDFDVQTASSESSLALSRAMTDSEIDYGRYRLLKNRRFSDPWLDMRLALDAFPPGYLDSMNRYLSTERDPTRTMSQALAISSSESKVEPRWERHRYNEEFKLKMERFFEEECRVFSPDDPGLIALEEALQATELKSTDSGSNAS